MFHEIISYQLCSRKRITRVCSTLLTRHCLQNNNQISVYGTQSPILWPYARLPSYLHSSHYHREFAKLTVYFCTSKHWSVWFFLQFQMAHTYLFCKAHPINSSVKLSQNPPPLLPPPPKPLRRANPSSVWQSLLLKYFSPLVKGNYYY